jgi:hypothetical protein
VHLVVHWWQHNPATPSVTQSFVMMTHGAAHHIVLNQPDHSINRLATTSPSC